MLWAFRDEVKGEDPAIQSANKDAAVRRGRSFMGAIIILPLYRFNRHARSLKKHFDH
jgi:hypothetical protein